MPSSPEHHAKYMREVWYPKNRKRHQALVQASRKKRVEKRRAKSLKFRESAKCCKCGESDPACLDFHHKDPSKKEADLTYAFASWSDIRIENEI